MGHKRKQQDTARNLVAKHAREFNKAHIFVDRKHKARRGYRKHKGEQHEH